MLQVIYFNRPIQILHCRALNVLMAREPLKFVGRPCLPAAMEAGARGCYGQGQNNAAGPNEENHKPRSMAATFELR